MHNVVFKSIRDIELEKLEFPQVAVYDKPDDYPNNAVARVFDNGKPTNIVMVADDPEELKNDIRKYTKLGWCTRGKDDVPELVGVYL